MVHEHHPVKSAGVEAEEIAEGLLYYKSIASLNVLDTGDGLVMLDAGHLIDVESIFTAVRKWRAPTLGPRARLAAAVFSHHHVDHIFGTKNFETEARTLGWEPPLVYGHEAMPSPTSGRPVPTSA